MAVEAHTEAETPYGDALYERARHALPGGNTRATVWVPPHPPYASRGEGWRVWDTDGREVVDLQANYTALVHGHAYAPVVRAAAQALAEGSAFGLPTAAEVQMAEHLAGRVGWAQRWRFATSGTEAVMIAVRVARAVTGRNGVVRFRGCYHGNWDAVVQPDAPGVPRSAQADVVTLPVGDRRALCAALDEHGARTACVLLDLMPSRAGLHPADPEYVALVRAETARRGIALVLDEVITFRLAPGGMAQTYGVEGDMVVLGKSIGGGLPCGAVGGRAEWMDVLDPRRPDGVALGGTFTANPVSLAAGLAALQALDGEAIARIDALGERLRAGLRERGYTTSGRGSLVKVHVPDPVAWWWRMYRGEPPVLVTASGVAAVSTPMDEAVIDRALAAYAGARGA